MSAKRVSMPELADCYFCRNKQHAKCIDGKAKTSRVCGCKH